MNQKIIKTLDLSDGTYPEKVLSYYLWGQEKPPTPNEIADIKWIDREESIAL